MLKKQGCVIIMVVYPCFCPKVPNFSEGLLRPPPNAPSTAHGAGCAQRCCDGAATESLL